MSQDSGLARIINPDRIGWDLQIIDEQKWIVCVWYGREFRWGKWPYSEKQSLQSQLIDGKLILDCQPPPVVDVKTFGSGPSVVYEDLARAERGSLALTECNRRRQRARARIDRFLDSQPLSERRFFRLSEIIEYCARSPDRLIVDRERKVEIFELVRTAIHAGEFGGERVPPGKTPAKTTAKPTRIRWISEEPLCPRWLPRDAAAPNGLLFSVVNELLISRGDAVAWFQQRGADPPEWITPKTEARSVITIRQLSGADLDKEIRDALKTVIDVRAVVNPSAPLNGKEQATEAMKLLGQRWIKAERGGLRRRVEEIADEEFTAYRRRVGLRQK